MGAMAILIEVEGGGGGGQARCGVCEFGVGRGGWAGWGRAGG